MAKPVKLNPILNSPYAEPVSYYATNESGELDYERVVAGRRSFIPDISPVPVGQGPQKSLIGVEAVSGQYDKHLINRVRVEVGHWRRDGYPNTTRITRELLRFWFEDTERIDQRKLFFAQREVVESAIWLNEVPPIPPAPPSCLLAESELAALRTRYSWQLEQGHGVYIKSRRRCAEPG
jgi:type III restriction enzyme